MGMFNLLLNFHMFVSNTSPAVSVESTDGLTSAELLTTNWQTTAAVGLTVATGGVTGALMLTAFPAQTLAAAGGISALAYTGKRRAEGKAAFPFMDKDTKSEKEEAKAEV